MKSQENPQAINTTAKQSVPLGYGSNYWLSGKTVLP